MQSKIEEVIHQEKVPIGPLWYLSLIFVITISAYLINKAPIVALPVVIGAFLIVIVETVFSYPIRYNMTADTLIAKSGLILKHEIRFDDIKEIETISWYKLYFYVGGNRVAGMPKNKVVIINPKTDRLIITPGKETLNLLLSKVTLREK